MEVGDKTVVEARKGEATINVVAANHQTVAKATLPELVEVVVEQPLHRIATFGFT